MNVIVVNDNAHVNGGAAKVAIQEAVGLADRGHSIYFVCAVQPIAEELVHSNITIVCSKQYDLLSNPNQLEAFIQGWWNTKAARLVDRDEGIQLAVELRDALKIELRQLDRGKLPGGQRRRELGKRRVKQTTL